ncbi:MAG: molybdenum ABC transporter ATP-binding protein [bacterium]|nr:molybdenum ABC transporter ATP-binding protein [bacterium]
MYPGFELEIDDALELEGVTAIFGASGSGKSTLLRAIAGFERPVSGIIAFREETWFDAVAGVDVKPHQRPVGMLFQDARLFDHLDVTGNLVFAEKRRSRNRGRFSRGDVVSALDLGELLQRRIVSLSGGERQRVALARTLLSSPDLLLLDEPLSGLDRERKAEILPYLEEMTRRFRIPTLFVSHDIDEVARLADRVWVFAGGRLQTSGTTSAIVERLDLQPLTGRFEAGVLVEGRVARHDPRLHLTFVDLHGDEFTMPLIHRLAPGDPVRLRIRARDVAIATQRPIGLSIRNVLPGRITDLISDAESGSVEALIQLREDRIRARLTLAAVEELELEVGSEIFALVKSVSFERGG